MLPPTAAELLSRPSNPRSASLSRLSQALHRASSPLRTSSPSRERSGHLVPEGVPQSEPGSTQSLEVYQPGRHDNTRAGSPNGSGLDMASSIAGPLADEGIQPGVTIIHAGPTAKPFTIHTELLRKRSAYFAKILPITLERPSTKPLSFPDIDEVAFKLFVRWIYGDILHGPSDFHSMNHYVSLYVLGLRFRIERLRNVVMDLVRDYYNLQKLTAPPYRLDYIYAYTSEPCHMRNFLVTTAAYRTLCSKESKLSQAMRDVVAKGGDLAVDYCSAMASLSANGLVDVRKSPDCLFHDHVDTPKCKGGRTLEPYHNP